MPVETYWMGTYLLSFIFVENGLELIFLVADGLFLHVSVLNEIWDLQVQFVYMY